MRRHAFTLIELLVVIAIIGILSTLVVTQLGASQIKARNATAQSDIAEMGKVVDSFRTDDVASGTVVSNPPSGTVDTLSGTSGTLTSLFTGTQNVQGLTYAALVQKTPSSTPTGTMPLGQRPVSVSWCRVHPASRSTPSAQPWSTPSRLRPAFRMVREPRQGPTR